MKKINKRILRKAFVALLALQSAGFFSPAQAHGPIPVPLEYVTKQLEARDNPRRIYSSEEIASFPSIESDIQAISKNSPSRSQAMSRLLARQSSVIPQVRAALLAENTDLQAKRIFLWVLGQIKEPGTENDIIAATEDIREKTLPVNDKFLNFLYGQTFTLLGSFDDLAPAIAYADKLLDNPNEEPIIHSRALFFLAENRIDTGAKWFEIYRTRTNDLSVQYAVLYLGAMQGIQATKPDIIDILINRPDKARSHTGEETLLLRGLINLTTADEFQGIVDQVFTKTNHFPYEKLKSLQELSKLYKGSQAQRADAAIVLLRGWGTDARSCEESIRYMIQIQDAMPYLAYWRLHDPVLIHYLFKSGHTISFTGNKATFVKSEKSNALEITTPEHLASRIIESLANNKPELYQGLFINQEFLNTIQNLQYAKTNSNWSNLADLKSKAVEDWKKMQQLATRKGIKLQNARLQSARYAVMVTIDGMQITSLDITIEASKQQHHIILENSVLFDGEWRIVSGLHWL